jgi:hypothetical protein
MLLRTKDGVMLKAQFHPWFSFLLDSIQNWRMESQGDLSGMCDSAQNLREYYLVIIFSIMIHN